MALLSETLPIPDSSKAISLAIENGDLEALQVKSLFNFNLWLHIFVGLNFTFLVVVLFFSENQD